MTDKTKDNIEKLLRVHLRVLKEVGVLSHDFRRALPLEKLIEHTLEYANDYDGELLSNNQTYWFSEVLRMRPLVCCHIFSIVATTLAKSRYNIFSVKEISGAIEPILAMLREELISDRDLIPKKVKEAAIDVIENEFGNIKSKRLKELLYKFIKMLKESK